ncbi:izumo sperm-egg fusion protein 1 isoform X2 [Silurus meridionalis]|uniref:izumo sperm-egg fusion protein 1 isoform X2 n=1 Tax=Silurus meridionalis TaxID=175797 RepID=UPI001EEA4F35|nr:izumo sperm-egg fusion protein 1 isoform X2 [Silurus meridionalis]
MAAVQFSVCWLFLCACVIPGVRSCLQCDLAIRHMHEDFISTKHKLTVQEQMDLVKIINHAYVTYQETSTQFSSGLIDFTTLYRAQTEYQSEFRRHWKEPSTGSVQWDMIKILEKGKKILNKHLEVFVAEGLCPNECVHQLVASEGKQAVLDCFLPWHRLVVGHAEYHYSWKPGATNFTAEDEFEVLVVTQDSRIVLNQLRVSEQGVYHCFLLDQHGTTISQTHFLLTVTPVPTSPPRQIPTLPSLPHVKVSHVRLHTNTLIIILSLLTSLSITGSMAIILYVGMTVRRQKKGEAEESRQDRLNRHSSP